MSALLMAIVDAIIWYGLELASKELANLGRVPNPDPVTTDFVARMENYLGVLNTYYLPGSAAFFLFFALLLWLFLRISNASLFKKAEVPKAVPKAADNKKRTLDALQDRRPDIDKKEKEDNDRRIFLYLLSLLQREGRLLDFFSENLDAYEDDQIGAAVRSIHQNCKKAMDKNLALLPVVDMEEGGEMTVAEGFDPNEIKLTGAVTGDPPFKGILRHKGWKAKKIEIPMLSSTGDAKIIAPAEVEIP
jgi:hypothetical protein